MSSFTRRDLLRFGGVALSGGLAGCNTVDRRLSTPPQLGKLAVINYDPQPHTIHVLLLADEDPVYWASKAVPPADGDEQGGTHFTDLPTAPDNYVLHVRADTQPASRWERFDFGEYDVSCLSFKITIDGPDQPRPGEVSIWKTTNPHECKDR